MILKCSIRALDDQTIKAQRSKHNKDQKSELEATTIHVTIFQLLHAQAKDSTHTQCVHIIKLDSIGVGRNLKCLVTARFESNE